MGLRGGLRGPDADLGTVLGAVHAERDQLLRAQCARWLVEVACPADLRAMLEVRSVEARLVALTSIADRGSARRRPSGGCWSTAHHGCGQPLVGGQRVEASTSPTGTRIGWRPSSHRPLSLRPVLMVLPPARRPTTAICSSRTCRTAAGPCVPAQPKGLGSSPRPSKSSTRSPRCWSTRVPRCACRRLER